MKNRDQIAARNLLIQREKGWSIIYAIKRMKRRFLLYTLLLLLTIILRFSSELLLNTWSLLIMGFIMGAFLRDIGWLILIKKNWPFTEKITDWDKIKEIADEE